MEINPVPSQEDVNVFLDSVRKAGAVNMFGAAPFIVEQYGVTKHQAKDMLLVWMDTFSERARKGEVVA